VLSLPPTRPTGLTDPLADGIARLGTAGDGATFHVSLLPLGDARVPHVGLWRELVGLSPEEAARTESRLRELVDAAASRGPLIQAVVARWPWRPHLGVGLTPYESANGVGPLLGTLREWCVRYVHAVTPSVWLGPKLLSHVDRSALSAVANVTALGDVARVDLAGGHALDELERALDPILPRAEASTKMLSRYKDSIDLVKTKIERLVDGSDGASSP
jgi:hypothetical protein